MILKTEIFAYKTPLDDLFKIHLQDPSADPDTLISPNVRSFGSILEKLN